MKPSTYAAPFQIIAIIISFLIPILFAYALFFSGYGKSQNKSFGSLIQHPIQTSYRGFWRIITINIAKEDPRLPVISNRILALGKDAKRVSPPIMLSINRSLPTHKLSLSEKTLITYRSKDKSKCFWFIIDPQGYPVLCYPQDTEPKKIDLDLRKLLKNTSLR